MFSSAGDSANGIESVLYPFFTFNNSQVTISLHIFVILVQVAFRYAYKKSVVNVRIKVEMMTIITSSLINYSTP